MYTKVFLPDNFLEELSHAKARHVLYFPEYLAQLILYIYFKTRFLLCFSIIEMCDADSKTAPYSFSSHDCHKCNLTWKDNICIYDIFSLDKLF